MAHSYSKNCVFDSVNDIKDKHVTVMGLGLNGGGEAAVRFFLKKGAFVTVTDMKNAEQLSSTIQNLSDDKTLDKSRLKYKLGSHDIEDFKNADCVIKNPGVKYEGNKFLAEAKAIETDLSIFLRFTKAPVIAVTGSKGKSSTVSAIHFGLKKAGFNAYLGGNITVSPLTFFDEVNENTPVVLELSSWQLADLRGRGVLKPKISLITKIVPDHQNWYKNMKDYVSDKQLIYKDQDENCCSIFDCDDDDAKYSPENAKSWGELFASESKAIVYRYSKKSLKKDCYGVWQDKDENGDFCGKIFLPDMKNPEVILKNLLVPGEHMKANALNAAFVLYLMGVKSEKCAEILSEWPGIEHRLQFFYEWNCKSNNIHVKFYNDSCATVPEAAAAATQAFGKPVILITGGTDKGLNLSSLTRILTNPKKNEFPVEKLFLLEGTATDKILPELKKSKINFFGPYKNLNELTDDLIKQFDLSKNSTEENSSEKIVLFSPGATSFGMFNNEFDRGKKFMNSIKERLK